MSSECDRPVAEHELPHPVLRGPGVTQRRCTERPLNLTMVSFNEWPSLKAAYRPMTARPRSSCTPLHMHYIACTFLARAHSLDATPMGV